MGAEMDFFDTTNFPARWDCGNWKDWGGLLGWMRSFSDLVIFASFMTIPLVIVASMRKRREVLFPAVFWIFCIFIIYRNQLSPMGCGAAGLAHAALAR